MTRDEQKLITTFVIAATAATEPELDVEADAIIRALFVRHPEAAYRITLLAMTQQASLAAVKPNAAVLPARGMQGWLANRLKRFERQTRQRKPALTPPVMTHQG